MGEISFVKGLLMFSLFSFAMIMFSISFGSDNSAAIQLGDDGDFVNIKNKVDGNLTTFQDDINSSSSDFFESSADSGDQVTTSGKQFKVGYTTLIGILITIMGSGYSKIFGNDPRFAIFLSSISGILIFIGARYAYKSWWGRNPD